MVLFYFKNWMIDDVGWCCPCSSQNEVNEEYGTEHLDKIVLFYFKNWMVDDVGWCCPCSSLLSVMQGS